MAVNTGYEVLIGTDISADKKAEITSRVLQVIQPKTLSIVYAATYAAGTGSTNQATIAIGTTTDFGIRLIMDSAVVGATYVAELLGYLIAILVSETITLSHAAAYAVGSRVYNITVTIS